MLAGYANMPAVVSLCSESGTKMSKVIEGIRVLDFGRYIAGPVCATLVGDMGAEVILIEKVDGSEDRYLSPINENGDGAMFMQMGRNKKSVTLNPMKPEGREIFKKLVATADVVVENLRPGSTDKLGIGYNDVKSINPRLIYAAISGFGRLEGYRGPDSDRPAFDIVAEAMLSLIHI